MSALPGIIALVTFWGLIAYLIACAIYPEGEE